MDKFEKMILSHVDAKVEAIRYMITDYEYDEPMTIHHIKDYIDTLKDAKIMLKGITKYGKLKTTLNVLMFPKPKRKPRA